MLRLLEAPEPKARRGGDGHPPGPVVIWNLVRRCNLQCKHCYSVSADIDFPGELTTQQALGVIDDLYSLRAPVIIMSGGEPLMRRDLFTLTQHAKAKGFFVALSTNGTLIDIALADAIAEQGYDYVGISLDGLGPIHDRFRRKEGAFDWALWSLKALRDRGVKVGVRFTLTSENEQDLPGLIALAKRERFPKFYLSHLVYAGRGNKNRGEDANWSMSRKAVDLLITEALAAIREGQDFEIVTGNNDADAVHLLRWAAERYPADRVERLRQALTAWGGNSSGVGIANIDNLGNVHPDTMWWRHTLGNVKERPFSAIWNDLSDPLLAGLRQRPRKVTGRCGDCRHLDICGGNTRVRAWEVTGDPWGEDPGCYLTDDEIGVAAAQRVETTPFRGIRHDRSRAPHSHAAE
jgi:heme d1 biosynthesis radical SAM protein NirJ